ncbi:MAG: hypothetical protein FWC32_07760 [Firmicutes bacterium]|nr:hypothetical protein [Bacillota bacterium]
MTSNELITNELKGCFDFFWNEANTDKNSPGYGLVSDKNKKGTERMASIASVGFGLSAIVIGAERGFVSKTAAMERAAGTLKTCLNEADQAHGFLYHFLDLKTAKKYEEFYDCASIIDTSILLNGALTAAEYFKGEVEELFEKMYAKVDWQKYYDKKRNLFFMGYQEDTGGFGQWDIYAEQLMQYILGIASPTFPVPTQIYNGFRRDLGEYSGYSFYNSPAGSLFTHQFSHAWYNFNGVVDKDGINWFDNSVKATLASRQYSINNPKGFKTFHKNAWGLTACEGPEGYRGFGTPPFHPNCIDGNDGTVPPCGAIGSIIFTSDIVLDAMAHYTTIPGLIGKYGFNDAYNQDVNWVCEYCIGIDKGISIVMLENYLSGMVHELYMNNGYIKKAAGLLGWIKKGSFRNFQFCVSSLL